MKWPLIIGCVNFFQVAKYTLLFEAVYTSFLENIFGVGLCREAALCVLTCLNPNNLIHMDSIKYCSMNTIRDQSRNSWFT